MSLSHISFGQLSDQLIDFVDYYVLASQKDSSLLDVTKIIKEPEKFEEVLLILNDSILYELPSESLLTIFKINYLVAHLSPDKEVKQLAINKVRNGLYHTDTTIANWCNQHFINIEDY